MTFKDIPFADSLRELAGWNQTTDDWERLLTYQPDGCMIAEWEGERAGTVTTTSYGKRMAWIGMLLVHPKLRGCGIGTALLEKAINHLRFLRIPCIKLDATPQGQPIYDRLGFKPEWTLQRWEARRAKVDRRYRHPRTVPWRESDGAITAAIDLFVMGASRRRMIWALARRGVTLVHKTPKGRICGFGMMRPGSRAHYLGPIVAEQASQARPLVKTLLVAAGGQPVFWDIPDHQEEMVELARHLGFHPQRPLVRMYLGERNVPGKPEMIFGIAAPETG